MSFQASCPACAAPVTFDVANSVVTVCPSCRAAVGRGDGKLENLGKVADLVQTDTPLRLELSGKFKGVHFKIKGRTQIRHAAGGVWDEWYIAFKGGKKWGWLAEAQGRLYLTFEQKLPREHNIPSLDELEVEDEVVIPGVGTMSVAEISTGEIISAEGEIPVPVAPGEQVYFADLSGAGRKFGTLDQTGGELKAYAGGEVTLEEIGLADALSAEQQERRVAGVQVSCPKCGGPLDLKAPDQSLRVACPYCASMLECNHGNLKFLEALGKKKIEPVIPLGTKGTIDPVVVDEDWTGPQEFTVIGFMQRRVMYEGRAYPWTEYLLYQPRMPFYWLIHSNGHWNFGKGVPAGEVAAGPRAASWDGKSFAIYERGAPEVTWVIGEFYWQVSIGEKTSSADYIKPPYMLSRERSDMPTDLPQKPGSKRDKKNREINYTVSRYFPVEEVEKAFGVKDLRKPASVGPNQPFPYRNIYAVWGLMLLAAIVVGLMIHMTSGKKTLFSKTFTIPANQPRAVSEQIKPVGGGDNVMIQVTGGTSSSPNFWVYVDGELYDEASNKQLKFGVPTGDAVYLPRVPAGEYLLKFTPKWKNMSATSPQFTVKVVEDVPHFSRLVWLMIGISVIPGLVMIYNVSFNYKRWEDSDYSPFNTE